MGRSQGHLREFKGVDSSGDVHPIVEPPGLEEYIDTLADALPGDLPVGWDDLSMQEKMAWYNANAGA